MNKQTMAVPRSIRFQPRVWDMATKKATYLGIKVPAYLSQLIVKDNKGG